MCEQSRKTWQTSLFASKHLETSVKVFFPPFEECRRRYVGLESSLVASRYPISIKRYRCVGRKYGNIDNHFRPLFAVKPELARESGGRAMNLRFRDSHEHPRSGHAVLLFVFFYLLRADGAFFRTRRDDIRAWTRQRMGYWGLIPMDRSILYMTLSPSPIFIRRDEFQRDVSCGNKTRMPAPISD